MGKPSTKPKLGQVPGTHVPDALAYWEYQESQSLGDMPTCPYDEDAGRGMASGWWILPIVLLSGAAWAAILLVIF